MPTSILIIGATGLIGNIMFRYFSSNSNYKVYGSIRDNNDIGLFSSQIGTSLISGVSASDYQKWHNIFNEIKPNIAINCLGITKHLSGGIEPLISIPINAYFPHFLNSICIRYNTRLIHISSDCVFSGARGDYIEEDVTDANDIYGRTKAIGEVVDSTAITLRTSTIGHELKNSFGLLEWFLGQKNYCKGYKNVFFSGVPTIELARIIDEYVICNPELKGLYHVGAAKISKFDLLNKIAQQYGKKIEIIPEYSFRLDRSINSERFYSATGYRPASWDKLIRNMYINK